MVSKHRYCFNSVYSKLNPKAINLKKGGPTYPCRLVRFLSPVVSRYPLEIRLHVSDQCFVHV